MGPNSDELIILTQKKGKEVELTDQMTNSEVQPSNSISPLAQKANQIVVGSTV